ncbi:NUDIX domain-containing protein [Streptomyces sp. NPDC052042]|uniref:NUDIX domain-containing protein n=1 Tax=Streptomyces sp. NPDC052042 TaxID=3365683 RepID=UPI0037D55DB8
MLRRSRQGMWELPGGKTTGPEAFEAAAVRGLAEETSLPADCGRGCRPERRRCATPSRARTGVATPRRHRPHRLPRLRLRPSLRSCLHPCPRLHSNAVAGSRVRWREGTPADRGREAIRRHHSCGQAMAGLRQGPGVLAQTPAAN